MKRPLTIQKLMILVLVLALEFTAAMSGALPFAITTLSCATIVGFFAEGRLRGFLRAFAAVGWATMGGLFGLAAWAGRSMPTLGPLIQIHQAIYGPFPITYSSPEEANAALVELVRSVKATVDAGHALLALAAGVVGGLVLPWAAGRRRAASERRGSFPTAPEAV